MININIYIYTHSVGWVQNWVSQNPMVDHNFTIWRILLKTPFSDSPRKMFPEMVVPLNHPSQWVFPLNTYEPTVLRIPPLWKPPMHNWTVASSATRASTITDVLGATGVFTTATNWPHARIVVVYNMEGEMVVDIISVHTFNWGIQFWLI